jgi:hypothetical protein
MTETHNLKPVLNLLSFPGIENISVAISADNFFGTAKKNTATQENMELPVNNYLKTPDEIEREFQSGLNSRKAVFQKRKDSLNNSGAAISKTAGFLSIHNLDEALSGFMEENY